MVAGHQIGSALAGRHEREPGAGAGSGPGSALPPSGLGAPTEPDPRAAVYRERAGGSRPGRTTEAWAETTVQSSASFQVR